MTITIKKVTEYKLQKYLNKIGWSIKGNFLNRQIFNDYGEPTNFYIEGGSETDRGHRIEIRKEPFGRSFSGHFQLDFDDLQIKYHKSDNLHDTFLSLVFLTNSKNQKSFISFYPNKMRDEQEKQN